VGVTVTVWAPAKLTVSLRIIGVRPDGYHLIDAEMVSLDVADRLDVALDPTGDDALEIVDPDRRAPGCVAGPENLVTRALAVAGRRGRVTLTKSIPDGAGLGGGSADAAAILRAVGHTDGATALRLGADVPFCVVGGRARVEGIGEIVTPLDPVEMTVTLVTPPVPVSTPAVYAAWDRQGEPTGEFGNDLEAAACDVGNGLVAWRTVIEERTGHRPRLAGSGSTWWLEGDHVDALEGVTVEGSRPRLLAAARTVPAGWDGRRA
jgi:4-diphosphocytidyl-2-C-methyl-D-erythritol kinase